MPIAPAESTTKDHSRIRGVRTSACCRHQSVSVAAKKGALFWCLWSRRYPQRLKQAFLSSQEEFLRTARSGQGRAVITRGEADPYGERERVGEKLAKGRRQNGPIARRRLTPIGAVATSELLKHPIEQPEHLNRNQTTILTSTAKFYLQNDILHGAACGNRTKGRRANAPLPSPAASPHSKKPSNEGKTNSRRAFRFNPAHFYL